MDKAFLNKIQQIILEHLEDENLNVERLAFEIGLSRSQLFRKLKATNGKSVNQFIREIRLIEAAKLIRKDEFTASEIAYRVGFSSPSYFNKCFHDYFGLTPGNYKEQSEEEIKKIVEKANSADIIFFKKPKVLFSVIMLLIVLLLTSFFVLPAWALDVSHFTETEYGFNPRVIQHFLHITQSFSIRSGKHNAAE